MTDITRDAYSQFIRFAKIGFPVLAALLLIGIFTFNKVNPIRDGVVVSEVGAASLSTGQIATNPHYTGVTKSGDTFSISASSALPNAPSPDLIDLVLPNSTIGFTNGLEVHTTSNFGQINLSTQEAIHTGSVLIVTSDNYIANSEKIVLSFYTGNAYSPNQVTANGPMGKITAGTMRLTQGLHDKTSHIGAILSFGNGVKLVYYPIEPTNKAAPRE